MRFSFDIYNIGVNVIEAEGEHIICSVVTTNIMLSDFSQILPWRTIIEGRYQDTEPEVVLFGHHGVHESAQDTMYAVDDSIANLYIRSKLKVTFGHERNQIHADGEIFLLQFWDENKEELGVIEFTFTKGK